MKLFVYSLVFALAVGSTIFLKDWIADSPKQKINSYDAAMIDLSDDIFSDVVANSSCPVVLVFFAPWSKQSVKALTDLEEICSEYFPNIKLCRVNIDECPSLISKFNVHDVPLTVFYLQGRAIRCETGVVSIEQFYEYLTLLAG